MQALKKTEKRESCCFVLPSKKPIESNLAGLHTPHPHSAVATARAEQLAVTGEIKGVNVLLMSGEETPDLVLLDIPHPDLLILSPSRQKLSIRAEAHRTDVKVSVLGIAVRKLTIKKKLIIITHKIYKN